LRLLIYDIIILKAQTKPLVKCSSATDNGLHYEWSAGEGTHMTTKCTGTLFKNM